MNALNAVEANFWSKQEFTYAPGCLWEIFISKAPSSLKDGDAITLFT
jgi:hypothetical protein